MVVRLVKQIQSKSRKCVQGYEISNCGGARGSRNAAKASKAKTRRGCVIIKNGGVRRK